MRRILFILVLLLPLMACNDFDYEFEGSDETFSFHSDQVQDDYLIYVYLPPGYSETAEYPLIVGLDGDSEFYNIEDIVSDQIIKGKIPPAIFVGIGYGSVSKNETLRNRDYTPSETSDIEDYETGGAANFYAFLKDELIPELHLRYSLDSNRATLLGHSYGGLFSLFAMFQDNATNPFDKFIPVAASFWYDSGEIFNQQEGFFANHNDLPAAVYTTMGSLEGAVMVISFGEMNERLENEGYPGLRLEYDVLEKYGHSRADYISFERGLEYVFNH